MQKKWSRKLALLFTSLLLIFSVAKAQNTPAGEEIQPEDSINGEAQEESFQDFLNNLVDEGMDVAGWDTKMINSRSFDPSKMTDTVFVALFDSTKSALFIPPFSNYITSGFGPRHRMFHYGMDIKLQVGDSVHAAFDGIVRLTKYDKRGYGNAIVIRHMQGIETIYGHLSKVLVEPNQRVKAGDLIGLGGNSGRSTGSHLHFETRYKGEPFDPSCFYDFQNHTIKCDRLMVTKSNFAYLIEIRKAKYCVVRKGDTLGRIASRYHSSVKKICKLNGLSSRSLLRVGKKLRYQ